MGDVRVQVEGVSCRFQSVMVAPIALQRDREVAPGFGVAVVKGQSPFEQADGGGVIALALGAQA